jgi:general secretion pathway protein B
MSSILKALKKLEEEKAARRAGVDIARGIVKSIPVRQRKQRWLFPVSISAAAFSAALLTYFLMGGPPENKRAHDPPDVSMRQSDVKEGISEIAIKPGVTRVKPYPVGERSGTGVSRPKLKSVEKVSTKKASPEKSPLSLSPEISVGIKNPNEDSRPQNNVHVAGENASRTVRQPAPLPLPMLHVSGIAWNKDDSERFAVVNGASVSEGMKVGGAVVERIFQDKVRFSFENRTFDVAVGNEMR